jgi:hypothetical protein
MSDMFLMSSCDDAGASALPICANVARPLCWLTKNTVRMKARKLGISTYTSTIRMENAGIRK